MLWLVEEEAWRSPYSFPDWFSIICPYVQHFKANQILDVCDISTFLSDLLPSRRALPTRVPCWSAQKQGYWKEFLALSKVVMIKISIFIGVLRLQYIPLVLFNVMLLPSSVGFLIEFLWLIAPFSQCPHVALRGFIEKLQLSGLE